MNIKQLMAAVGGFFGPDYSVTIDFELMNIKYHEKTYYSDDNKWDIKEKNIIMDGAMVDSLENSIESLNLKSWDGGYLPKENIYDGTTWQVKMKFDEFEKVSYGENAYPIEWNEFCRTIEDITGEKFR